MASARAHNESRRRELSASTLAHRAALPSAPAAFPAAAAAAVNAQIDPTGDRCAELIAPLQLFAGLPRALLGVIGDSARTLHFAKGDYVFKHGETHHGFYVVVYGKVQLLLPNTADEAKVLAIMERGMSIGEAAMFMNIPFPVSARASEDTVLVFIPQQTLDAVLAAHSDFARQLLAQLSRRLHALVLDIAGYTQKNAGNRIAAYLLEQVQQSGKPSIHLDDRKQAIASRLSVAPETLSRTLRLMQQSGIIRVKGYRIDVIDLGGLGQLAER